LPALVRSAVTLAAGARGTHAALSLVKMAVAKVLVNA